MGKIDPKLGEYMKQVTERTKRDRSGGDSKDPVMERERDMPHFNYTSLRGTRPGDTYDEEAGQLQKSGHVRFSKDAFVAGLMKGAAIMKECVENPKLDPANRVRQLIATMENAGLLGPADGSGPDQGDRPRYSREMHDETADEDMSARDHLDEMHAALTQARETDDDDECDQHVLRAMSHGEHYFEKREATDDGGDESIGDPDGSKLEEAKKVYEERTHASDLQRDAVRISSNASIKSKQGQSHFGGFPARKV